MRFMRNLVPCFVNFYFLLQNAFVNVCHINPGLLRVRFLHRPFLRLLPALPSRRQRGARPRLQIRYGILRSAYHRVPELLIRFCLLPYLYSLLQVIKERGFQPIVNASVFCVHLSPYPFTLFSFFRKVNGHNV